MKDVKKLFGTNRLVTFALLLIIVVVSLTFSIIGVRAADMPARDYMNRNIQGQASGITHQFIITPTSTVAGRLIVLFPDADDGMWCRTAGTTSLTTIVTGLNDSATALPGTLTATCTQGSGSSSYDTILITGVTSMTGGNTYGVIVSGNAGALGTPNSAENAIVTVKTNNNTTDIDSRNIVLSIISNDQITVSGKVDPTMTFTISNSSIGFGSITSGALRYADNTGVGLGSTAPAGQPVSIAVSTNGQAGAVVQVRDFNANSASGMYLNSPSTTLTSRASSAVAAGTIGFGVFGKNASTMTLDAGFNHDGASDLAISTSFQPIAVLSAAGSGSFDLEAVAAVAAATPPGDYADTLTVVATGRF